MKTKTENKLSHTYSEIEQKFNKVMDIEAKDTNSYWRKMGFAAGLLWVLDGSEFEVNL